MIPQLSPAGLAEKARWVRHRVLDMATHAKSGHVSTAYSQTELLVALYYGGLLRVDPLQPKWAGRDRFILSKGQGGIGLYPILADLGFFPLETLENFAGLENILGVHAEWNIPGIEVITGSLGHGLPLAVGMAQAAKGDGKFHKVVCLLGDAELYEGSNWEAAILAGHLELDNLVCIIDRNGQGVLGFSEGREFASDGPRLEPLDQKFAAFGFEARIVDGHSFEAILSGLQDFRSRASRQPLCVIARTQKGFGTDLIANRRLWHYRVPHSQELDAVRQQIDSLASCSGFDTGTPRMEDKP